MALEVARFERQLEPSNDSVLAQALTILLIRCAVGGYFA